MALLIYAQAGAQIRFPVVLDTNNLWSINQVLVANGTGATLTFTDRNGVVLFVVLPYTPFSFLTGSTQAVIVQTDGTAIKATDVLNVQCFSQPQGITLPGTFGPSTYSGGAVPNSLSNIVPGQPIGAWTVQQIINFLTGVMTGQAGKIANTLELAGASAALHLDDQDGIGGDFFSLLTTSGQLQMIPSVVGTAAAQLSEASLLELMGTAAGVRLDTRDASVPAFLIYATASLLRLATAAVVDLMTLDSTGIMTIIGAGAELDLSERSGGGAFARLLRTGGRFEILDNTLGALLTLGPTTLATAATRLSAVVGADAARLLNKVPIGAPASQTASGTGDLLSAAALLVSAVGTTATYAYGSTHIISGPAGMLVAFYTDAAATRPFFSMPGSDTTYRAWTCSVVVGATATLYYLVTGTGGAAWSFGVTAEGYDEPA